MAFSGSPTVLGTGLPIASGGTALVAGPASSTDNSLVRWDGTGGNLVQNSSLTLSDTDGTITQTTTNGSIILTPNGNGFVSTPTNFVASGSLAANKTSSVVMAFASGAAQIYAFGANASTAGAFNFRSVSSDGSITTIPLAFDATQDALFTPTTRVRIVGTKVLSFGATANATIGVSADTTAGVLTFTAPSAGSFSFSGGNLGITGGDIIKSTGNLSIYTASTNAAVVVTGGGSGGGQIVAYGSTHATRANLLDLYSSSALGLTLSGGAAATLTGGAGNMTITSGTGNSRTMALQTTTSGGTATTALSIGDTQNITLSAAYIGSTSTRSGPGACDVTTETTKVTSTGVGDALTLANGVDGQTKIVMHDVDGGSFVLTPATAVGWTTFTSTIVGESITLKYVTTRGWTVIGSRLGVIA